MRPAKYPSDDLRLMHLAAEAAARGRWTAPPNPPVGAVVAAADGEVVSVGHHRRRGDVHAEVAALDLAGDRARGATMYVTLEPCDHHGRTPPCTEAILAAGVARVVVAVEDPHPVVAGSGLARLRSEGVEVTLGPGADEVLPLYERHHRRVREGRPAIIAKVARTLDGRIGQPGGKPLDITGPEARAWVGRRRSEVDGVLVGSGTVLADDPLLTARDGDGAALADQPRRIVLDARLRTPPDARLFDADGAEVLILTVEDGLEGEAADRLRGRGARLVAAWPGPSGGIDPTSAVSTLADLGLDSILVEGGAGVLTSLAGGDLIDLWHVWIGPLLTGDGPGMLSESLGRSVRLGPMQTESVGGDLLVSALPDGGERG